MYWTWMGSFSPRASRAESFSELLDMFYTVRDRNDAMRQKSQSVRKTVQNLCTRLTKKLADRKSVV